MAQHLSSSLAGHPPPISSALFRRGPPGHLRGRATLLRDISSWFDKTSSAALVLGLRPEVDAGGALVV